MIAPERVRAAATAAPARGPARAAWDGPLAAVLWLLPPVALTELVLMRTFYRVGIHIPKQGAFRTAYGVLTTVGSFALNLSTVLVMVALVLLAARASARGSGRAGAALAAFASVSVLLSLAGPTALGPAARLVFVLAVAAVAVPFLRRPNPVWHRVAVAGVAAAALLSAYAGLAADAATVAPSTGAPGGVVGAQLLAEALVVASAFALAAAWVASDRWRPGPFLLAIGPAVGLLALWRANGAITGILVLWTAGLRLYLPLAVYVVALWAFAAAAFGWRRVAPARSAGLVLLLAGGMLLGSTYVQALVLLGLVLLTDGVAVGGLPIERRTVSMTDRH